MTLKKDRKKATSSPLFDNLHFAPLRQVQSEAMTDYETGLNLILTGYAGTGKTYIAVAFALEQLKKGTKKKIRLIRTAQAVKDIGFLPGTEDEKLEVYERAFTQVFNELLHRDDGYECLKKSHQVEFNSTSYLRGMTFNNEIMIVDEAQNLNAEEVDCIITRAGKNTQIIFCGDERQSDIRHNDSGWSLIKRVGNELRKHFSLFFFDIEDIVRSGLVRDYIVMVSGKLNR